MNSKESFLEYPAKKVKKNKLMNLFVITIGARPPVLNCKRKMNKI